MLTKMIWETCQDNKYGIDNNCTFSEVFEWYIHNYSIQKNKGRYLYEEII